MEEILTKSTQEASVVIKKVIKPKHLPVEGTDQISLSYNCQVLTPSLGPGDQEDTLFVDAPHHVKVFKFNPKTYQFTFSKALPKIPSKPDHLKRVDKGPFFSYSHSGRTMEIIGNDLNNETKEEEFIFRRYRYRDLLQDHNNGILVEDNLIKNSIFPDAISLFEPLGVLPHFISHQNLFFCLLPSSTGHLCSLSKNSKGENCLKTTLKISNKNNFKRRTFHRHKIDISLSKLAINYEGKPHLAALGSPSDHIRGFLGFKNATEMFVMNLVNLRNKRVIRRVDIHVREILGPIGYLEVPLPKAIEIVSSHYFKDHDCLFLNFVFKFKEAEEGKYNMFEKKFGAQILIEDFSNPQSRKTVKLSSG